MSIEGGIVEPPVSREPYYPTTPNNSGWVHWAMCHQPYRTLATICGTLFLVTTTDSIVGCSEWGLGVQCRLFEEWSSLWLDPSPSPRTNTEELVTSLGGRSFLVVHSTKYNAVYKTTRFGVHRGSILLIGIGGIIVFWVESRLEIRHPHLNGSTGGTNPAPHHISSYRSKRATSTK